MARSDCPGCGRPPPGRRLRGDNMTENENESETVERPLDRVCVKCGRTYHYSSDRWYCVCGTKLVEKNEKDEELMRRLGRL
jgi:hypothetical protein